VFRKPAAIGLLIASLSSAPCARAGWRHFTTADGLASTSARYILEDHTETLWFATFAGVSRFDGISWQTFTTTNGLASNIVTCILEDRNGVFWFGTDRGVTRYDGTHWQTYTLTTGLLGNLVNSITEDRAGNLWFATNNGATRFDGQNWTNGIAGLSVECVFEDRAGTLWFGTTSAGVYRFDGSYTHIAPAPGGLASGTVRRILESRDGSFWFATNAGASRLDAQGAWTTYTTADGLASNNLRSMFEDRRGILWFGTVVSGVTRFDGRMWQSFLEGLPINEITQDRSGNIWFAQSGGVTRFDGVSIRSFPEIPELYNGIAYKVTEDRDGSFWIGSENGAFRFDGRRWERYTASDSVPSDTVLSVIRDRRGNLWFSCWGGGIARRDTLGAWRTFTTADGLASQYVRWCYEDPGGTIWAVMSGGVSRFDDPGWTSFTIADGLPSDDVMYMTEDRAGNLWFTTRDRGIARLDPEGAWWSYDNTNGLAGNSVWHVFEDRDGSLWFTARGSGLSRRDPLGQWTTITSAGGLSNNFPMATSQDRDGNLWFGQDLNGGVTRYNGSSWRTLGLSDGLPNASTGFTLEDTAGDLWISSFRGAFLYSPDRVPPRTVISSRPPAISASRRQTAAFAALGESERIEFSWRLDGGSWSPWSASPLWSDDFVSDGNHVLEVRARDYWTNVDPTPEATTFQVDAIPPVAVIASPAFGAPVHGTVEVRGTAKDARFQSYEVAVRREGASTWTAPDATLLASSPVPVNDASLAQWDTSPLADGRYEVRLAVVDALGLTGTAQVTVVVDNVAPFADVTSPIKVTAAAGGHVYTTGSELHLYVPPNGFTEDAVVTIRALSGDQEIPPVLSGAGAPVGTGYELSWAGGRLRKPATLDVSLAGVTSGTGVPAIYRSADGTNWSRLGGTRSDGKLSLAIQDPGRYALYLDSGAPLGGRTVSALSFTPRVFSPAGTYGNRDVGIAFTLGRPGSVTVKVYDRSGKLTRVVTSGQAMGAGSNLVRWDGRDRDGTVVRDDLYLITVEAFGETQKKALSVVR